MPKLPDRRQCYLNNIIDRSRWKLQNSWCPKYVIVDSAWIPEILGSQLLAFISIIKFPRNGDFFDQPRVRDDKLVVADTYDHLISLLFSPTLDALSLNNKPKAQTLANSNEDITHAEIL